MPDYRLGDIHAWIDNQAERLADIRPSTVVSPGFEVHLDDGTIMPGKTGTLRVDIHHARKWFSRTRRAKITPRFALLPRGSAINM